MLYSKAKLSVIALILLLSQQAHVNGLRVLGLFFHPGLSHFHFFHPVLRGLAEAGHEVTVVSHFPDSNPPKNYKDVPLQKTEVLINAIDFEVKNKVSCLLSFHIVQY